MKLATILLENGEQIPCVLRNMSKSDAKLGVGRRHLLPESFALAFSGCDSTCRVTVSGGVVISAVSRCWQRTSR